MTIVMGCFGGWLARPGPIILSSRRMAQSTQFGSTQASIAPTLILLTVDSHLVFMAHQIKQGLVPLLVLHEENPLHYL
jgi:hypothetical protein